MAGRLETGIIQCDDDWPGVFIRGDNAAFFHLVLRDAVDFLNDQYPGDVEREMHLSAIKGLAEMMGQPDVRNHDTDTRIQKVTRIT